MVYRRKKRGGGLRFKFQSFVDVQTSASSMQVLQWSVGGPEVIARCRHLFGAYKYFKLGKISVKMVPASTLPVDPLQLSYADDDPQSVDPRDQMNPGLVRITNGEDIFTDVSSLTDDQQQQIYNAMMLDPRWSKFMLQSGFRRTAYPLFWQIGQLHQDKYPGTIFNVPSRYTDVVDYDNVNAFSMASGASSDSAGSPPGFVSEARHSSPLGLFQVGHKGRLGFLPTDMYQDVQTLTATKKTQFGLNNVPEVSVITCVLPKAHKTEYYYRVFITEEVIFAGLRSAPVFDDAYYGSMGLDNFVLGQPVAISPKDAAPNPFNINNPQNDGQGDTH